MGAERSVVADRSVVEGGLSEFAGTPSDVWIAPMLVTQPKRLIS